MTGGQAWKIIAAALAILGGTKTEASSTAQQALFAISSDQAQIIPFSVRPDFNYSCKISSAMETGQNGQLAIMGSDFKPQPYSVGTLSVLPLSNSSEVPIIISGQPLNGVEQNNFLFSTASYDVALLECDDSNETNYLTKECGFTAPFVTDLSQSRVICPEISPQTKLNCTLFSNVIPGSSWPIDIRLKTHNYFPDSEGFSADAVISLNNSQPFDFTYSSQNSSTMQLAVIPGGTSPTAFFSCSTVETSRYAEHSPL